MHPLLLLPSSSPPIPTPTPSSCLVLFRYDCRRLASSISVFVRCFVIVDVVVVAGPFFWELLPSPPTPTPPPEPLLLMMRMSAVVAWSLALLAVLAVVVLSALVIWETEEGGL